MNHWLEILPNRYGLIEKFNNRYPLRTLVAGVRTLEIGAGLGTHLRFEKLEIQAKYVALELQPELAKVIRASYPAVRVAVADCQEQVDFPDGYFDRVLTIHSTPTPGSNSSTITLRCVRSFPA